MTVASLVIIAEMGIVSFAREDIVAQIPHLEVQSPVLREPIRILKANNYAKLAPRVIFAIIQKARWNLTQQLEEMILNALRAIFVQLVQHIITRHLVRLEHTAIELELQLKLTVLPVTLER